MYILVLFFTLGSFAIIGITGVIESGIQAQDYSQGHTQDDQKRLIAQVSLWQNQNPYGDNLKAGELLEVKVQEIFNVKVDSKWTSDSQAELSLTPDTKNLPFLSSSEQSKANKKNASAKYRIKDELNFSIPAVIGQPQPGSNLYPIQARKSVIIDLKPTQIVLTGLIHPKYVKNSMIHSKYIAELQLNITSAPPIARENTIGLKPPKPEDIKDPNNPPASKAELSEEEKQKILLQHLQRIIGVLNN